MRSEKSILFINRVYPPVKGASGYVLQNLAEHCAKNGYNVTVLTTGSKSNTEHKSGVRIVRVHTNQSPKSLFSYLWILLRLCFRAMRLKPRGVVVTMTDPPFLIIAGWLMKVLYGCKHIHWLQDLYPDLMPVVKRKKTVLGYNSAYKWMRRLLNKTDKIMVIGRCMSRHLSHTGVDPTKVRMIANWSNLDPYVLRQTKNALDRIDKAFFQKAVSDNKVIRGQQKFTVLYAGSVGLVHEVKTILNAAEMLQTESSDIEFVFLGEGKRIERLHHEVQQKKLRNIRFIPFQPVESLQSVMEIGDVHLVTLRRDALGLCVPSKYYTSKVVARPVVFLGPSESEIARDIQEGHNGIAVENQNVKSLVEAIKRYRHDADYWYETHMASAEAHRRSNASHALDHWLEVIKEYI